MCVSCQMMLLGDHEEAKGKLCGCGQFRLGRGDMNDHCYHCFSRLSESGETCPVCAPEIPEVFFDDDMAEELARVRAARVKETANSIS